MKNNGKVWLVVILLIIGIVLAIILGIYSYGNGGVPETNMIATEKLAREEQGNEDNEELSNQTVETSSVNKTISPNAIVEEKRYYKTCDHLIREVVDIPESLVNQTEEEVKNYYSDWKVESYSPTEITVYKEFQGICDEHYIVKDNNGVLSIFKMTDENEEEWQEDTEIEVQYLPEEDIEKFKKRCRSSRRNKPIYIFRGL